MNGWEFMGTHWLLTLVLLILVLRTVRWIIRRILRAICILVRGWPAPPPSPPAPGADQ